MKAEKALSLACWAASSIAAFAGYSRLGPTQAMLAGLLSALPWILQEKDS
jgi:hypothetical protein